MTIGWKVKRFIDAYPLYDAMLDRLSPDIFTLGVCFGMQRVPYLPEAPSDHPVMGVITEKGLTWFHHPEQDD